MSDLRAKAPWHLWAVGIVTLLWNAVGVYSYLVTELGQLRSVGMTESQIAYFDSFPAWAVAVWALGVWGAFTGSLLLLLRSRLAVPAFMVALVGLVGTAYFQHVVADIPADLENPVLDLAIWLITPGTLWYAMRVRRAGVLR